MCAPYSPLPCVLEATLYALAAWQLKRVVFFAKLFLRPANGLSVGFEADGSGGCATHLACPFLFLESNAAAKFSRIEGVHFVNTCVLAEHSFRAGFG